jgi:hypothetical protein
MQVIIISFFMQNQNCKQQKLFGCEQLLNYLKSYQS